MTAQYHCDKCDKDFDFTPDCLLSVTPFGAVTQLCPDCLVKYDFCDFDFVPEDEVVEGQE